MNALNRTTLTLATAVALGWTAQREAAAQYVVAYPSTTSVVAYQPVVVPTSPALVAGWYPGKVLDRWAANRLTYRSAAIAAPVATSIPVTSYQPVVATDACSSCAVTSYRPVTGLAYQSTYLPYRTYRPLFASPYVATTAYSPVLTTSAACCDTGATTVTGYATSGAACCGTSVSDGAYYGEATDVPALPADEATSAQRPVQSSSENGGNGAASDEKSVKGDGEADGQPPEQNGGTDGASWEPPALRDPRLEASPADADDNVARRADAAAIQAVYKEKVHPRLVTTNGASNGKNQPAAKAIPSRAEREAMWTAVTD